MVATIKIAALLLLALSTATGQQAVNITGALRGELFLEPRIINGTPVTDVNTYPFMVAVVYYNGVRNAFAQATAVNKYFAVTSGYVSYTISINKPSYKVISNALDVFSSGVVHNIANAFPHPDYFNTMYQYMNNIGLIKVCPGLLFNNFALLPSLNQQFVAGTPCVYVSWGSDLMKLTYTNVVLDNFVNCNATATINSIRPFNGTNDFCTLGNPYQYNCVYSDGTPLLYNNTVIGMNSWAGGICNGPSNISGESDTQVSPYVQWINQNIIY